MKRTSRVSEDRGRVESIEAIVTEVPQWREYDDGDIPLQQSEDLATDLIANTLHFASAYGHDVGNILRRALDHYNEERPGWRPIAVPPSRRHTRKPRRT